MAEENKIFTVEIITPDRIFYKGEGDMIEFTTAVGEIGVYKKHIPLTTVLAPGVVKIHTSPQKKKRCHNFSDPDSHRQKQHQKKNSPYLNQIPNVLLKRYLLIL